MECAPDLMQRRSPTSNAGSQAHGRPGGVRALWRLINTTREFEPSATRAACTVFLIVYAAIAFARYEESHGFLLLRIAVCAYAAFGIWLASRLTWTRLRLYQLGSTLVLPLQAAYIDGILGNHVHEVALTALATFCMLVFVQTGVDLVIAVVALIVGHAAILVFVPPPALPMSVVVMMLGSAIATGASAAIHALLYRGRWVESLTRVEEALTTSAEWEGRYRTAILASGQILFEWDIRSGEVRCAGACEALLGYAADELRAPFATWSAHLHPDDVEAFEREIERVLTTKRPLHACYRARRKDGVYVVVESRGHFIFDDGGEAVRMIGFLSDVTERTHAEAERAQEAATSAALARVGSELISSLEKPVVLQRLCRLTTEVLDCDVSTTWLVSDNEGHAMAGYAFDEGEWDQLRHLQVPAANDGPLMQWLTSDDVVEVRAGDERFPRVGALVAHFGLRTILCVALRRGDDIVGVHVAGCHRRDAFTPAQERIARGIAQLASMALTNAGLVEELEQASRLKSEFLSTMSHELRTPLNVILGYADMLADDLAPGEPRHLLQRIRHSSVELLEMIEATLNVNRLSSGQDEPQIEAVALSELWDDLRAEYEAVARPSVTALCWEPIGDAILATDRRKLKRILKNLIGNALKFTPSGSVTVRCERRRDSAVLSVADTGIGIPAAHLSGIFEMFRQVDSSDARSYGGVGLGLYIVRKLVEQLGGTIEVESEPGCGSTFRVYLPAPRVADDGQRAA